MLPLTASPLDDSKLFYHIMDSFEFTALNGRDHFHILKKYFMSTGGLVDAPAYKPQERLFQN